VKVLVIGAGAVGVATAYYLHRHGCEVALIDANPAPGMEASLGNGGCIHANVVPPWNEPSGYREIVRGLLGRPSHLVVRYRALPSLLGWGLNFLRHSTEGRFLEGARRLTRLGKHSLACFQQIAAETGINFHHRERGFLRVFRDTSSLEGVTELSQKLSSDGAEFRVLTTEETIELEPALAGIEPNIAGGLYSQTDQSGDAAAFCRHLTAWLVEQGVTSHLGESVRVIRRVGQAFHLQTQTGAEYGADRVVLATGSDSPVLARQLGVKLPIRPAKGYSITLPAEDWLSAPRVPLVDTGVGVGIHNIGERHLRVVGGAEFAGYDRRIPMGKGDYLLSCLKAVFPDFAGPETVVDEDVWCGFRPVPAHGLPIIGNSGTPNFYLNTGHGYMGWTMSAASGSVLADHIVGKQPALPLHDYGLPL